MQLQNHTRLYVVGSDGTSEMTFGGLTDAIKGGTRMEDIKVFTDRAEAEQVECAMARRRLVAQFSTEEMLRATQIVLVDAEGRPIQKVDYGHCDWSHRSDQMNPARTPGKDARRTA